MKIHDLFHRGHTITADTDLLGNDLWTVYRPDQTVLGQAETITAAKQLIRRNQPTSATMQGHLPFSDGA